MNTQEEIEAVKQLEDQLQTAQLFNEAPNAYTKEGFRQRLLEVVLGWHTTQMNKRIEKMAAAITPKVEDIKEGEELKPTKVNDKTTKAKV